MMIVRLEVMFEKPSAEDSEALRTIGRQLTNAQDSVQVFPKPDEPQ